MPGHRRRTTDPDQTTFVFNIPPHLAFIFLPKPIAHIPGLPWWIRPQHLEHPRLVLQQPMGDPRGNNDQVPLLHHWLDPSGVLLAAKKQPCTPGDDSEDLMRGRMEMRLAIHSILPLGDHRADVLETRRELRDGGVKGGVVDQ